MKLHQPVLLNETIDLLGLESGDRVVDLTAGYGGHSKEILKWIGRRGELILNDQDKDAINYLHKHFESHANVVILQSNFAGLEWKRLGQFDAILLDLGVSSPQLDEASRGFSFNKPARLDMRMDRASELSAYEIVNEYSQTDLSNIIYRFGEERRARQIARQIVEARREKPIETTTELAKIVGNCFSKRPTQIHPATKTFQAIRIAVNNELTVLEQVLPLAFEALKRGGRLAVISFHSLEDRIVKQFFKALSEPKKDPVTGREIESPQLSMVTKKPIKASEFETNPRARSAKLRVAEKIK